MDGTMTTCGARRLGYADSGGAGVPVLWCHGGPGSRLEPAWLLDDAREAGLRLIGIDRPGYGRSSALPGRTIADGAEDVVAVADHLGIDRFVTVGVSTGGAYALAVAALHPDRVLGVVACCSVTDVRHEPARVSMHAPHAQALWDAPDRATAIALADEVHGRRGEAMLGGGMNEALAPTDMEIFRDPAWLEPTMASFAEMFAQGNVGYADGRLADGPGWISFDVQRITCPVTVLHGTEDKMTVPLHAQHTAAIVPGAELVMIPELGHFSVERHIVAEVLRLLERR